MNQCRLECLVELCDLALFIFGGEDFVTAIADDFGKFCQLLGKRAAGFDGMTQSVSEGFPPFGAPCVRIGSVVGPAKIRLEVFVGRLKLGRRILGIPLENIQRRQIARLLVEVRERDLAHPFYVLAIGRHE